MGVAMVSGMPAMIRARFGTPTVGRDWLVGTEGTATTVVTAGGTVSVEGGLWPARIARGKARVGDVVTVVGTDGVVLEVEPKATPGRSERSRS